MSDRQEFSSTMDELQASPGRLEPLRYRSQFILGPAIADRLTGWQRLALRDDLWLTAHPELTVSHASNEQRSLTLLGFILDPARPKATNQQILNDLLSDGFMTPGELIKGTSGYGGRWLLVATYGDDAFLFHDALGLRQAFYTDRECVGNVWAMSQPGLVEEVLDLRIDDEAFEYMDSYEFRVHPEYRWPAAGTPYKALLRLLPNHYLDINTGTSRRYWPETSIRTLGMDECVNIVSEIMQGMMRALSNRFNLAMGVTAGLDSRVVLAASKAVKDQISFITVRQSRMKDNHADIMVPSSLLTKLGIEHEVIGAPASMGAEFSSAYKKHVFLAHDHYGADAEAIAKRFHREKVVITGSGAEVGRCAYRDKLPGSSVREFTPSDLSRLQGMGSIRFVIKHFSDWLTDTGDRHNVKLLDLFEWEQGHGNWLATTQLEMDMAWKDIFTPYNCRDLLVALLSVDEAYRRPPGHLLFKGLITSMWPELLSEPINPGKRKRRGLAGHVRWTLRSMKWHLKHGFSR